VLLLRDLHACKLCLCPRNWPECNASWPFKGNLFFDKVYTVVCFLLVELATWRGLLE
jgi:hypothetical protein